MAAKKLTPQQQRDRRAKIMLAVLGVVLVAVLGFQLPTLMGGGGGSAAPPPAATTSASGSSAPSAALASAPAPSQLQRFTRFAPKDPFKAKVALTAPAGATTTAATTTSASPPVTTTKASPPKPTKPTKPVLFNVLKSKTPAAPTGPLVPAALLMFDGKKHVVPLGETFPANHPLFQLVSLAKDAVWLKLVGGSFANGGQTLKLVRGKKIELENTTADVRIGLTLVKPTTAPKPTAALNRRPTTGGG